MNNCTCIKSFSGPRGGVAA